MVFSAGGGGWHTLHLIMGEALRESDPLLAGLTGPQRDAVVSTEGPVLVLAGPGSGKTRVITRRIAYLLSLGIPAWQIMALTFTNKAAGEMRHRVEVILAELVGSGDGRSPRGLTITTFHSLCARLLRRYAPLMESSPRWGIRGDYTIYDADDQLSLMKKVITDMGLSTTNWQPRSILAQVSDAKNKLLDADGFAATAHDFHAKAVSRLYFAYEKALRAANAVDFDDLLMLSVRMLRENGEIRADVQGRWKYLMIDEYQDTNHAQFMLSTMLVGIASESSGGGGDDPLDLEIALASGVEATAKNASRGAPRPNVCVVGDPDQSIYGWRGADISNILDFEETYPGAKVIALGQNFRSTPDILAAADGLIRRNKQRKHKPLFTEHTAGRKPEIILCRDEHHEADVVLDWIKTVREGGDGERSLDWKDFAVFYRNNALSRVIEDRLRTAGVPYVMVRGTAFYQREEVRDAVAYLRIVANAADEVSLRRIINKPARKIGPATVERLAEFASAAGITLYSAMQRAGEMSELGPATVAAVRKFVDLVNGWTAGGTFMGAGAADSLPELVSRVVSESGLEAHYRAEREKSPEEDSDRLANLEEMVSSARDFAEGYDPAADAALDAPREGVVVDAPPLLAMLRAYLERVSLVADADAIDPAAGAVTLMTLHAAKGLEFPAVAMIGLEEGLLPSARAMENEPGEPEEERRLCFVGITRAMRRLVITSAKYRAVRGLRERTIPSRFLSELPRENVVVSDQSDAWDTAVDDVGGYDEGDDGSPRHGRAGMARGWGAGGKPASSGAGSYRAGGPVASAPGSLKAGSSKGADDPQFPAGCKVRHKQFGVGTVREVTGVGANRRAVIAFGQVGVKTLVLQYVTLERV